MTQIPNSLRINELVIIERQLSAIVISSGSEKSLRLLVAGAPSE